jgi:hypothetical protein
MCLTFIVGTNVGVLKNDQMKVLVVPSIFPTLLLFVEEASLFSLAIGTQCWEHQ